MFLGLLDPDPDPSVRGVDPDPDPSTSPPHLATGRCATLG
jgi:hypothetical protein